MIYGPCALAAINVLVGIISLSQFSNASIDVEDADHMTPLMLASKNGHQEVCKLTLCMHAQLWYH